MSGRQVVLVVDDEVKILEIVKSYLEKNGYQALGASTGGEAQELLSRFPVSLVLLDLMLPDIPGEELCRRIRRDSNIPVIMMTARVEEEQIIHGLSIGADDYVTKPFSPRQLMARVAAVLRRAEAPAGKKGRTYTAGGITVDTENRRVLKDGLPLSLTPNEYKILSLLISLPEKIFTRDEIIDAISGGDYDGFDRSIDVHISNLRQKIEDEPRRPRYIVTVYGMGYRFGGGE